MTESEWLTCDDPAKMAATLLALPGGMIAKIGEEAGIRFEWDGTRPIVSLLSEQDDSCDLIREIVGNPFRPVMVQKGNYDAWRMVPSDGYVYSSRGEFPSNAIRIESAWLNHSIAVEFAQVIVANGTHNTEVMLVLADMLEECGCNEPAILEHLRKERGGELCAWCEGTGLITHYHGHGNVGCDVCQKCNGTGRRKTPHARGCWMLALLIGEKT